VLAHPRLSAGIVDHLAINHRFADVSQAEHRQDHIDNTTGVPMVCAPEKSDVIVNHNAVTNVRIQQQAALQPVPVMRCHHFRLAGLT
jgi:hypothetical protein